YLSAGSLAEPVSLLEDGAGALRGPAIVAPVPDLAVVADARQHDMDVIVAVADRDPRPIPHVHLVHEPRSGVGPLAIIHLPVTRRGAQGGLPARPGDVRPRLLGVAQVCCPPGGVSGALRADRRGDHHAPRPAL